jgi:hypothetical protein
MPTASVVMFSATSPILQPGIDHDCPRYIGGGGAVAVTAAASNAIIHLYQSWLRTLYMLLE